MCKLYTDKLPFTVNTCMSQTDLNNFKLDVQKSDLPALLDKNLYADLKYYPKCTEKREAR